LLHILRLAEEHLGAHQLLIGLEGLLTLHIVFKVLVVLQFSHFFQ
jgi:hypothetical protein